MNVKYLNIECFKIGNWEIQMCFSVSTTWQEGWIFLPSTVREEFGGAQISVFCACSFSVVLFGLCFFFFFRFCFVFTKYWFIERCVTLNWHIDISRNCGYCFEKYNPTLTDSYHYLEPLLRVSETSLINNESESYWGEQRWETAECTVLTPDNFCAAMTSCGVNVMHYSGDFDLRHWSSVAWWWLTCVPLTTHRSN